MVTYLHVAKNMGVPYHIDKLLNIAQKKAVMGHFGVMTLRKYNWLIEN